jgi:uncharacterized membrane protein YozB (DUF420 family)
MAAIGAVAQTRPAEVGRRFYLVLFLAMAAVIVAGFSTTVPGDFAPPGIPLLLHAHGMVFTAWLALMIIQPTLVVMGNVKRHRQLGLVGAGLAAAMVAMALTATVVAVRVHMVPAGFPPAMFVVMNSLDAVVFGGLIAAAIARRREPEWHKRLMVCAVASILGPGIGRLLPMGQLGPVGMIIMFALMDIAVLAGIGADLIVRKRVHPAYLWGLGAIVAMEIVIPPLGMSPIGQALLTAVRGG